MNKSDIKGKIRIYLISRFILLLITSAILEQSIPGQDFKTAKILSPADVQFEVVESHHQWRPPFGLDRVSRSTDVIVTFKSKVLPAGVFYLVSYFNGKEVNRKTMDLINKTPPITGELSKVEVTDHFELFSVGNPDNAEVIFYGQPVISENTDQLALFFAGMGKDTVELARQAIQLKPFEVEAIAVPDRVINPVDLGAIMVPYDWLLLAGGQKGYMKIASLNRSANFSEASITVWYASSPENKVNKSLSMSKGKKVKTDLTLPACQRALVNDTLNVSIEDASGAELWHKQIHVMIVPNHPKWPDFGAVMTKLRYDPPILNVVNGKNDNIDYDRNWAPEFNDLVVCLPNGSRFVFWRGSSYIPIWAGQNNTGLSYEWAERISPNAGFVDCPEPLMDKELRFSRVEIMESTEARIHIRWRYQSCDFNYKVNGDLPVEDYYFYPDGFGTRVLTLRSIPEAEYEVAEFIILAPQAAFPLSFIPSEPVDIISVKTGEKRAVHLPETDQTWKKISDPSVYRIRLHNNELLSAISFNPNLLSKPGTIFKPTYDKGYLVAPAYWGGHWPLSRGFTTMWGWISESIQYAPSHNSLMSWATSRPKPVRSAVVETKDAFGIQKVMKEETWVWLIGMTDANDEVLLQIARSFAQPPSLELDGAKQDPEPYAVERRALHLVVENKTVMIRIKPEGWYFNPVFELENAPKKLKKVKLGGKNLAANQYAWDGHTLWLNSIIKQPEILELNFGD
jgi:hypothetical protein